MKPMQHWHGKILLFGEYVVLQGSAAYAMPFLQKQGQFIKSDVVDQELTMLVQYLKKQKIKGLDIVRLELDVSNGLRFESNIPLGYGCGSSGALIAAIWTLYGKELPLAETIGTLGMMESFYHGKSSGIDPLIIYYDQPFEYAFGVWHKTKAVDISQWWLYDSGIARTTEPLVQKFKKMLAEDAIFAEACAELSKLNSMAISQMNQGDQNELKGTVKLISTLQRKYFESFIPDGVKEVWDNGLKADSYYMKLCGAGGGGFFLILSQQKPSLSDCTKL